MSIARTIFVSCFNTPPERTFRRCCSKSICSRSNQSAVSSNIYDRFATPSRNSKLLLARGPLKKLEFFYIIRLFELHFITVDVLQDCQFFENPNEDYQKKSILSFQLHETFIPPCFDITPLFFSCRCQLDTINMIENGEPLNAVHNLEYMKNQNHL
jgi:hypothetical protein